MLYLVAVLVGLVGVGGMAAFFFAGRVTSTKLDTLKKQMADAEIAWAQKEANYKDQLARLTALEDGLKKEIASLEKNLADASTPESVRTRLSGLLSNPGST